MKERNIDLINLDRIDLVKGRSNVDLNQLSKLLLDNYSNKKELFDRSDRLLANRYEDSYCPPCP